MDEMIFGVECSIEVERLRSVVESYESGADRALVAYFLNVDFHQYCSRMGMFDIPKSKEGRLRRPTWIGGFSITAIKDYIWDAISTGMDKEDDVVDPALIRGKMNFDFIDNFSHEKELINELITEAVYRWNKEVKKAAEEEEKASSHDDSGKIPAVLEKEEEDDQERGQGDRATASQAVSTTSPLVPVIRLNPLPHTELKSYEFEIKIKKNINQLLDENKDIKDEEITTKLMENDVIRKRIEELQSYSFSPLIKACRRQKEPHRITTKEGVIEIMVKQISEKSTTNVELRDLIVVTLGPRIFELHRHNFENLCTEARRRVKEKREAQAKSQEGTASKTAKKGRMSLGSLAASLGKAKPKPPTRGLGRAKPKPPTHGLTRPSHRMQPQLQSRLQLQPQPSQQTTTQVRPGTKLDSIPLARIVEVMTNVMYQKPKLTMSELRYYVIHALGATNLKCYKVIQLDYQAIYDEVTNICNKVIQAVKDYRVEVCLKSLQQYAENMKRPVKKRRNMGYKLPEVIDIRSPPARKKEEQSTSLPNLDTDGLEIIKVQKDGDDIILIEGDLVKLDTVTVKQEPEDKPRISVKQEPDDKSSIPVKREDEDQQQTIETREKIIGSIEIIKKEELDVIKPIVEDPPLEDPKPVEEHLAADPDPIPDAIEEDPVDPSGGIGDTERTGEPAGVPGTEAENQLSGVVPGEPAPPPVVEETQTEPPIPAKENQVEPQISTGEPVPNPVIEETQTEPPIPAKGNQAEPQISTGKAEIDDTDWPVSKDQIEGILIVAMAEPNYLDYTIDDLLARIRKSTGSSFHPFRSQIAVLAARAKDNRIEEDVRDSARIQEEERKEAEREQELEKERQKQRELEEQQEREREEQRKKKKREEMKARAEAERVETLELISIEEREYRKDRKERHKQKKQQIVKGSHWEEVMARTKIVAFSGEAEDLETMSWECWRKLTERKEYLRISESERDGQQGTIKNKMKSFRKEKVKGLAKTLPKSLNLQGLRDEVVKIMDNENFREITFAELVYSVQRSTNEDLGSGLSIVRALFDEVREQMEEQEQADIAEKEAQERQLEQDRIREAEAREKEEAERQRREEAERRENELKEKQKEATRRRLMVAIKNRGDKRRGGAHTEINESLPMEEKIVKNRIRCLLNLGNNLRIYTVDDAMTSLKSYYNISFRRSELEVKRVLEEVREELIEKEEETEIDENNNLIPDDELDEETRLLIEEVQENDPTYYPEMDQETDDEEDKPEPGTSTTVQIRGARQKRPKGRTWHEQAFRANKAELWRTRRIGRRKGYFEKPASQSSDKSTKRKPGQRAIEEIKHYQEGTELVINSVAFMWYVRELLHNIWKDELLPMRFKDGIRMQTAAVEALQEATEAYLIQMFTYVNLAANHRRTRKAKRDNKGITITDEDLQLIRIITSNFEGCVLKESEKFGATSKIGDNEKEVKYGKPEEEEGEPKPKRARKGKPKKK